MNCIYKTKISEKTQQIKQLIEGKVGNNQNTNSAPPSRNAA